MYVYIYISTHIHIYIHIHNVCIYIEIYTKPNLMAPGPSQVYIYIFVVYISVYVALFPYIVYIFVVYIDAVPIASASDSTCKKNNHFQIRVFPMFRPRGGLNQPQGRVKPPAHKWQTSTKTIIRREIQLGIYLLYLIVMKCRHALSSI